MAGPCVVTICRHDIESTLQLRFTDAGDDSGGVRNRVAAPRTRVELRFPDPSARVPNPPSERRLRLPYPDMFADPLVRSGRSWSAGADGSVEEAR